MQKIFGGNKLLFVEEILKIANLKEGMKVADFGCGTNGYFVFNPSMVVGNAGMIYAVDVMKPALEEIKKNIKLENFKNIKTVWSNLEIYKGTNIKSSDLDIAFLVNTLHQSEKKVEILREVNRMLKKNSKLIVVDWAQEACPIGPTPKQKIDKENLKLAMQRLGYDLEQEFVAGKYHFGIIFKKL